MKEDMVVCENNYSGVLKDGSEMKNNGDKGVGERGVLVKGSLVLVKNVVWTGVTQKLLKSSLISNGSLKHLHYNSTHH